MEVPIKAIDGPVTFSRQKLQDVADSLVEWMPKDLCQQLPCENIEQSIAYRCRCSFQCVWVEGSMRYAVRRNKEPVIVDHFPSANQRIQAAMTMLQKIINDGSICFAVLRQNLTSVSFSSAWKDGDDSDCLLTLFYDMPIRDIFIWKKEATRLCCMINMTQITGRSRKQALVAIDDRDSMIRDTIWLTYQKSQWKVSLTPPHQDTNKAQCSTRIVYYEKPEGAFYHPNARAMCLALEWLIHRIDWMNQSVDVSKRKKLHLLELYCGCGAHTMPILQTNILEAIVAVELDQRLVDACQKNYDLNYLTDAIFENRATRFEIVSADAGIWSRQWNGSNAAIASSFDILLVDPPRQGLDEIVCQFANKGTFQHFLYVSCGRAALVRDLARLSDCFEVVDCTILDLFPQTDAVEALVHLRRRRSLC